MALSKVNFHREQQVGVFTTFTTHLDNAVKNMLKTCSDQTNKYHNHFKREYQTIGKAFIQLGASMQQDATTCKIS